MTAELIPFPSRRTAPVVVLPHLVARRFQEPLPDDPTEREHELDIRAILYQSFIRTADEPDLPEAS